MRFDFLRMRKYQPRLARQSGFSPAGNGGPIVLHIGTHKSGRSSLQEFLHQNRAWLQARNLEYCEGMYVAANHAELRGAAMRSEQRIPFRDFHRIVDVEELRQRTGARVTAFIVRNADRNLIFPAEGLAYLRHDEEIGYLAGLFIPRQATVVVYLRDNAAFLRSYRAEILRQRWPLSPDRGSCAYCEPDSWLVDYDSLIAAYARTFPNIRMMHCDKIMTRNGTIIPSFLNLIGFHDDHQTDIRLFLNVTPNGRL